MNSPTQQKNVIIPVRVIINLKKNKNNDTFFNIENIE